MPRTPKKSKYKHVVIKNKRYYFYKIDVGWISRVTAGTQLCMSLTGMKPSVMVTNAYLFLKDKKNVLTFASYEDNEELFSDRNVFPKGCIVKMERINI